MFLITNICSNVVKCNGNAVKLVFLLLIFNIIMENKIKNSNRIQPLLAVKLAVTSKYVYIDSSQQ